MKKIPKLADMMQEEGLGLHEAARDLVLKIEEQVKMPRPS